MAYTSSSPTLATDSPPTKPYKLRILHDPHSHNPRDDDCLSTIAGQRNRQYVFAEEEFDDINEFLYEVVTRTSFPPLLQTLAELDDDTVPHEIEWVQRVAEQIFRATHVTHFYSHRGYDAIAYIPHETVREEYGNLSEDSLERAKRYLEAEIEVFEAWCDGDVYGFIIEDADGEQVDSCWGFYGTNWSTNGLADHVGPELASTVDDVEIEY